MIHAACMIIFCVFGKFKNIFKFANIYKFLKYWTIYNNGC